MPVDAAFTRAEIFTLQHRYSGMVLTCGYRLADMLNNPTTEILEIRDVRLSQPMNPKSSEVECTQVIVKKDSILLAIPTGGYQAPSRGIHLLVNKQRYQAQIVLPGYTLEGTIHLPGRANAWILLADGSTEASFVPITDVTVRVAAPEVEPWRAQVAIFRRPAMESLYICEGALGHASSMLGAEELPDPDAQDLAHVLVDSRQRLEPEQAEEVATIPLELPSSPEPFRRA